ncbi:hypothetical protein CCAX7_006450 [Capsulimonas corticalis]|uniref:Uncharacterized protein n=1 Tax=Capsulimonas corticalis TaxID=2219043 RepID=A0A402D1G3_9BACT|nr:TlpA disulfide reductase family protein [Capsulimonas corticalis]BDI28594.1 hypothetical protein CCAX7_006450 [Capsulimonas corticalis]
MSIPPSRRTLRAAGVLATFSALCAALPAQAAPVSPIAQAKTVHMTGTFSMGGQDGKRIPVYQIKADIARPASFHVVMTPASRKGESPSALISDGKVAHEVNGFQHTYQTIDVPKMGAEPPASEISHLSGLDVIWTLGAGPASPNIHRAVRAETLDGRAMTLRTDTYPARSFGGHPPITEIRKLWSDAKTGLPYRSATYVVQDGKTHQEDQMDFHAWTVGKPIAAARFAWAPPADAKEYIAPKLLAVGTPAPDFAATAPDGTSVKLSDYKGKIVVVDFWATWCGPCQASMPHLEHVYQQVKDKDVAVLAVCVWDTKPEYDKWVAAKKSVYSFPTAFDPAGRGDKSIAGGLYKVAGIPTQYVIDKDGKIAAAYTGFTEGAHPLEDALHSLNVEIAAPAKSASAR